MRALDPALVAAVLEDWRTAPVPGRLRGALALLEVLTLRPSEVTASTMRAARASGLNDRAIREAAYVCFLFSALDRVADALDFTLPTEAQARTIGGVMLRFGYGLAKLPG